MSTDANLPDNFLAFSDSLKQIIAGILKSCDAAISEYELISQLKTYPELEILVQRATGDTLALFRIHFLVCHVLYQLKDEWLEAKKACLDISPLEIQMRTYESADVGIANIDNVRDYYLDLNNLIDTDASDVDDLITSFWVGMNRFEHRDEALAVLGLSDPVDNETIRSTYRSLVMQHHPDRGGETEMIQQLNDAASLLLKIK